MSTRLQTELARISEITRERDEAKAQRDALRNKVQAHVDAFDAHVDTLGIPFEDGGYEAREAARKTFDSTFDALREALAVVEEA